MLDGMPVELLLEIFRLVLVKDFPIDTHGPIGAPKLALQRGSRTRARNDHLNVVTSTDLSLLAVSRWFREIAREVFWKENTFRVYARTADHAETSARFLSLQTPPTRNLVRKLEIELSFGQKLRAATMPAVWCSQLSPLVSLEGLDNSGRLKIHAKVDTDWGRPKFVICDAVVGRVLEEFEAGFKSKFPHLDYKHLNFDLNIRKGWCVAHAPAKAVPQRFIACIP